jgi:UDP-N-acetylmuramoylalanine--D-glutamate ligase
LDQVGKILAQLQDSNVLVVGLARSGISAAKLLTKLGARVTGTDRQDNVDGLEQLIEIGVNIEIGGDRIDLVAEVDLVVLSPGVWQSAAIPTEADRLGVPWIGELELASRLTSTRLIAVTGTNGKSTTASLCAHLLKTGGYNVFLGGNIGNPLSELGLSGEEVDWAVVEVSSFQLEHLNNRVGFVPQVGIWLNLTADHIDRHGSLDNYAECKRRMFVGLEAEHTGVFFLDDQIVRSATQGLVCGIIGFGRDAELIGSSGVLIEQQQLLAAENLKFNLKSERLLGEHNAENAAAAVAAVLAVGMDASKIQAGLDSYPGLPHRLEPIRILDGVRYVNDSKGTNVDATAKSITSFEQPIILIAGGRGKGSDYKSLSRIVTKRVKHLVLIGEDAAKLEQDLTGAASISRAKDMSEAVLLSRKLAQSGEVVLLSPACASFDMFKNYEHRGEVFSDLVRGLEERA